MHLESENRTARGSRVRSGTVGVAVAISVALTLGCSPMGARAVRQARFDYNEALIRTWNEQMLLNLVRLRYRDTPFFLEVQSVSTQYEFEGRASASPVLNIDGESANEYGFGAQVGYSERPTISYIPLMGDEFAGQLLSPLPIESLELLALSGWAIDRIYRTAVQNVNGLENAATASGPTPQFAPRFDRFQQMTDLLRELQINRAITAVARAGPDGALRLVLRLRPESEVDRERAQALKRLLDLDPERDDFWILPGPADKRPDSIIVSTRSLMSVLFYLSHTVEPPPEDVEAGAVTQTVTRAGEPFDWQELGRGLFRVHASDGRPSGAFAAVRYRGKWFYIRDDDLDTKSTFGLLSQLFNLQAGQESGRGPVLTLPVGS